MNTPSKRTVEEAIATFLEGEVFAVAGASDNRAKYGNKVLRCYWQHERTAHPINPKMQTLEDAPCYPNVGAVPGPVHGLSLVTPPSVSAQIVTEAAEAGITNLWFQPGAEGPEALRRAEALGMNVIAGGPCLLVVLGYHGE